MVGWTWAAASLQGIAHAQAGERRQDACRVLTAETGFVIAVACDGAGSTIFGGYGAAIVARVLSNRAKDWVVRHCATPSPGIVELWVAEVRLMLNASAERLCCVAGDFATTMVMVVTDGANTLTAHVGDGAVVARAADTGALIALSWPENGEYAATTFFLTDLAPHLRIGVIRDCPIDRLAILTDGLERLALDFVKHAPHPPFFYAMFDAISATKVLGPDRPLARRLKAYLGSDAVNARTDDDKTLILAALG